MTALHGPVPHWVQADGARLRQCLANLAGNAVKFASSGHVIIRVEPKCEDLLIEVQDTGIGIPEHLQKRVFAAFEQGETADTCDFEGTGLGLAVTGELVRLMGGEITLRSQPRKGSVFGMIPPLPGIAAPGQAAAVFDPAGLQGLSVVIIDDLDVHRAVLRRRIETWGGHAALAATGHEELTPIWSAVERGTPPGLVILDQTLPDISGLDVLQRLRGDPRGGYRPVLMMSSMMHLGVADELSSFGHAAYRRKPARTAALAGALDSLLRSDSPQKPPRPEAPIPSPATAVGLTSGARLVVVDDSSVNRTVVRRMLVSLNVDIVTASDGDEAIASFVSGQFELVLRDLSTPRRDGYDTTRGLRDMEKASHQPPCPIIAVSALVTPDEQHRAEEAGMNGSLHKPVRRKDLVKLVQRWVPQTRRVSIV